MYLDTLSLIGLNQLHGAESLRSGPQAVTQFLLAFYGTPRFISVFTRVLNWFLSWARWIQSTTSHPVSPRSILILSSHLHVRFSRGLFRFPDRSFVCVSNFFHACYMPRPSHPPWFYHPNIIWWSLKLCGHSICLLPLIILCSDDCFCSVQSQWTRTAFGVHAL
jgi:hypothetical protein